MNEIQQKILQHKNPVTLISASAGSGKTTIMIEKIYELLVERNVDPENLAVVTFTELAANEMRERLVLRLKTYLEKSKDEDTNVRILDILDKIKTASIDTIDGFCTKTIRKYFYRLDINPNIDIVTDVSKEYLIDSAFNRALEQFDKNKMNILVDIFVKTSRNYDSLKKYVIQCNNFANIQPNPDEWLNSACNEYKQSADSSIAVKYINAKIHKYCFDFLANITKLNDYTSNQKVISTVQSIIDLCKNIIKTNDYKSSYNAIFQFWAHDFTGVKIKEEDKQIYNTIAGLVKTLKDNLKKIQNLGSFEENSVNNKDIIEYLNCFVDFVKLFEQNYTKIKNENNVLDFTDLERIMLQLLQIEEVKNELNNQYQYIFVDEYQDINPLQDKIICEILGANNIFMVGDLKQSIYRFRLSEPKLFLAKCENTTNENLFKMNFNFRSCPNILNFVDEVFSNIMTKNVADIDYKADGHFDPQRHDYPIDDDAVKIFVCNKEDKKESEILQSVYSVENAERENADNALNLQNEVVLEQIKQLIGQTFYDGSLKTTRNLTYSDIAILYHSKNDNLYKLIETLIENNIPINYERKFTLKESESARLILDILKVIANVGDDISFATFFSTKLANNLSYDEMANIKKSSDSKTFYDALVNYSADDEITKKINLGFENITYLQKCALTMNVSQLICHFLYTKQLYVDIITTPNGPNEINDLMQFLNSITSMENDLSIVQFLNSIDSNITKENKTITSTGTNGLNIMTIHKSKGLEYPVVILFDISQNFNFSKQDELYFDKNGGIGIKYYNQATRQISETYTHFYLKQLNEEDAYKEELRMLYVACTRAKNKLILTGEIDFENKDIFRSEAKNYLDSILSVYKSKIEATPWTNGFDFKNVKILFVKDKEFEQDSVIQNTTVIAYKDAQKNIDFSYPNNEKTKISVKNNVTAITKLVNDEHNIVPIYLNQNENLYLSTDEVSNLGTLYHEALEKMTFCNQSDFNSKNLDINLLKMAYEKLSFLTTNCIEIKKEAQFMMSLPYNEIFVQSNITDKVLVQGVVDLIVFFDDHIDIVDYKYSSLSSDSLKQKYFTQLNLYKIATQKAYNKKVSNCYIYSIKTGELIKI